MRTNEARVQLELPCKLTGEEITVRGRMLSDTVAKIDQVQAEKRLAIKEFADKLTGWEEQQRKLATAVRDGVEPRLVDCIVRFHSPAEGTKRITRMDTGELVGEQEMSQAELQLNLFAGPEDFERFMGGQNLEPPKPEEDGRE
jgi:hypothetical protein